MRCVSPPLQNPTLARVDYELDYAHQLIEGARQALPEGLGQAAQPVLDALVAFRAAVVQADRAAAAAGKRVADHVI